MASVGEGPVASKVLIVDISDFENRKQEIAEQLHSAAKDVGFFYIKGHDVPQKEIEEAFAAGQSFYDLPDEVKQEFKWIPDRYLGWRSQSDLASVTGNKLWEWASFGRYGTGGYDVRKQEFLGSRWPKELGSSFKDTSLRFQAQTHDVAVKLLRALAISLGRDEHEFAEPFDIDSEENPSFLAWNWYPPVNEAAAKGPPRLHAHADMDIITLLYQRTGDCGLEIAPGKDVEENPDLHKVGNIWNAVPVAKHWTPLDPIEGCITVNIGDGLQWWTDGLFKSTYHRVRAPKDGDNKGSRMSMPYFVNPKLNYVFQGPEKKFPPLSGFDLLAKTGNAYEARRNDPQGKWKQQAYGGGVQEGQAATMQDAEAIDNAVPIPAH
ncbi:hypothetical protein WJX74_002175 [Apatococcus lobatus]|uniref:Fe2OG dioxygenase domain-containing protein n=1 Tax=Apatococcus lobatus TaxID=904363 RepID=A0AAW1RLH3_9CHLO